MVTTSASKKSTLPRWAWGECPRTTPHGVLRRDGPPRMACREHTDDMTVDHVVPVAAGIDHRPTNLVAACATCNTAKGVVDADLFCMHVGRRTGEPWRTIWTRVRAALRTPI